MYVYIYMYIYLCVCVCVCVCRLSILNIYIYIYIYIYLYLYTHRIPWNPAGSYELQTRIPSWPLSSMSSWLQGAEPGILLELCFQLLQAFEPQLLGVSLIQCGLRHRMARKCSETNFAPPQAFLRSCRLRRLDKAGKSWHSSKVPLPTCAWPSLGAILGHSVPWRRGYLTTEASLRPSGWGRDEQVHLMGTVAKRKGYIWIQHDSAI